MITLENVSFKYSDDNIAIKNISLEISKGESVAFIGPNGSGKSTLLKLINGIIFPNAGKYIFDGNEINERIMEKSSFSKSFHKRMGFVFQNSEAQLFCTNVYDEVAFGPRQMGMDDSQVEKRADDCLRLLGISELKNRVPYHLSGGEKRKTAIAAVLSLNPEILVLDEPMNGLDPKTKRFLRDFLINLNKAGKTIICSTHDFEYVEGVFKRAVVFSDQHKIIRDDKYEAVINDDEFLFENNIK